MRLFYVALTRAKYQVAMALPETFVSHWNCLQYVLTQGAMTQTDVRAALTAFQQRVVYPDVKIQVEEFEALPIHLSTSIKRIARIRCYNVQNFMAILNVIGK